MIAWNRGQTLRTAPTLSPFVMGAPRLGGQTLAEPQSNETQPLPFVPRAMRSIYRRLTLSARNARRRYVQAMLTKSGINARGKIQSFTSEDELCALFDLALQCPRGALALEIGSYVGASGCYLGAALSRIDGHLLCVDTWQNETMPDGVRDTFAEFQKNTRPLQRWITPVRKRSDQLTRDDVHGPLHLAFLDGDHSYAATRIDADRVIPWLADGGVLAFHDAIHFRGVCRVIGEVLTSGEFQFGGNIHNLIWLRKTRPSQE